MAGGLQRGGDGVDGALLFVGVRVALGGGLQAHLLHLGGVTLFAQRPGGEQLLEHGARAAAALAGLAPGQRALGQSGVDFELALGQAGAVVRLLEQPPLDLDRLALAHRRRDDPGQELADRAAVVARAPADEA